MTSQPVTVFRLVAFGASLLVPLAPVAAQSAPTPPNNPPAETIKLSPFEVQADSDKSYGALNSNSLTAFNVQLDRLPISADIFTKSFMDDWAVTNVEQLLGEYSAGAGYSTSDPGSSADNTQPLDRNGTSYIQLRGLSASTNVRDGLLVLGTLDNPGATGVGYTSTWNLERVEVINGPQALLYGWGGGGGIINMVSKQARLGQPAFGKFTFKLDQYGSKGGQFDYGVGTKNVAVRLAFVDETVGGRRWNIGGPLKGQFGQIAFKLGNTILRGQAEQTKFDRITSNGVTLNAGSTSADSRNGYSLHYLLATDNISSNHLGNGASGAGVIANGKLNWGNVDSYEGWWGSDLSIIEDYMVSADSQWTKWLSTKISAGWSYSDEDRVNNTFALFSPNNATNTTHTWAMGMTGGTPAGDQDKPSQNKYLRATALFTNDLFGGKVHSQTILGTDFFRGDTGQQSYGYYLADSNFKPVVNPALVTNSTQGRTVIPSIFFPVDAGPMKYPLWAPRNRTVTWNGQNYVRMIINQVDPAKISPSNPLGVSVVGGGNYTVEHIFQKGIYGTNYSQWMDGKIDTLLGFRYSNSYDLRQYAGSSAQGPTVLSAMSHHFNYNFAVDFRLTKWLRPYASVSNSFQPPLELATDPYGTSGVGAKALGQEVGLKMINPSGTLSGTLAVYHVRSQNELYSITSTLLFDINPSGLNGKFGSPSVWIRVNRQSEGAQFELTSSPSSNWKFRASAAYINGTIGNSTSYAQLYNDQFYQDAGGNVTYRDGTIVTVNPNANGLLAASAGGVPLTIAKMNNPSDRYFANPLDVSGAINSAALRTILQTTDPIHGPILTGAVGLPISKLQINPGFAPIGQIPTSVAGELTTGYPEVSANFSGMYSVTEGRLRGVRIGSTFRVGWFNRKYYYYPNGPGNPTSRRQIFYYPTQTSINPTLGYTHRFHRVTWATQLNVTNILNHYNIIITPNSVAGYSGKNGATFDQQPRTYVWTNSFGF